MNRPARGNLIARTVLAAVRTFAGEHVVVLLLAREVEQIFGGAPHGKTRFIELCRRRAW
jgi:hypothetical protein